LHLEATWLFLLVILAPIAKTFARANG